MVGKSLRRETGRGAEKLKNVLDSFSEQPAVSAAVEGAVKFFAGWLLAGAVMFESYAPFCLGFMGAMGSGSGGLCALFGVAVGAFLQGEALWAIKYCAAALLIFAAACVFSNSPLMKKAWFMPAVSAFMAACIGAVYVADSGWEPMSAALFGAETAAVGLSAYLFSAAIRPGLGRQNERLCRAGRLLALCALALTFCPVKLFGVMSVGRCIAGFCVMAAAWKLGAMTGGAVGLILGAAADAAGGSSCFGMIYGLGGICMGIFSREAKLAATTVYIIITTAAAVWTGDRGSLAVSYETFLSSAAFMAMTERTLAGALRPFAGERGAGRNAADGAKNYAADKALRASEAFAEIYTQLSGEENAQYASARNIAAVFDNAADKHCARCRGRGRCYGIDYEATRTAQNEVSAKLLETGELRADDFPEYFRTKCLDIKGFSAAVRDEYRRYSSRREMLALKARGYDMLINGFRDVADVFSQFASAIELREAREAKMEERVSLYLSGKGYELACSAFRDGVGRAHIELSGADCAKLKRLENRIEKLSAAAGIDLFETETGDEFRLSYLEAEPYGVKIGVASMRRGGEKENGDRGAYFKTETGLMYVILSDGMGSGGEAAADSGRVIAMLEKLLQAGLEAETALRLIDGALRLKNAKMLSTASVDLMCVNLFTGATDIFKLGAAPTFVKTSRGVESFAGGGLSAGLSAEREAGAERMSTHMEDGCVALMVSDGVTGGEDGEWISAALAAAETADRDFAREIIETAAKKYGSADDMTVICVKMTKRSLRKKKKAA